MDGDFTPNTYKRLIIETTIKKRKIYSRYLIFASVVVPNDCAQVQLLSLKR
jgi:hypothetical protein